MNTTPPQEERRVTTRCLMPDPDGIAEAAGILQGGGLVAFPTETVYGLGADACNSAAVAGIFAAKKRPMFNPLIVHCADIEQAAFYGAMQGAARDLAAAFWPGPLTVLVEVNAKSGVSNLVHPDTDFIGLRVPANLVAQNLLRAFGQPLAAPSANLSGAVSPTTARHVLEGLEGRIDAVLEGGACSVGVESTIVLCTGRDVKLLRPGGIPRDAIESVLGQDVDLAGPSVSGPLMAPGQLTSHYAPGAAVRLNVTHPSRNELYLGFGPWPEGADGVNLSLSGDLREAAASLFAALRQLDDIGAGRPIAVAPIPMHGLGAAINDRLMRAAAPRDVLSS